MVSNQRRISDNPFKDTNPSWSPDSKRIAFASSEGRNFRGRDYEIYVMDADGGNARNLTNNRSHDTDPAWYSPVLSVAPTAKRLTMWGWLKEVDR